MRKRLPLLCVLVLLLSLVLGSFAFADTLGPTISGIGKSASSANAGPCPTEPHTVMVQAKVTDKDGIADVELQWKYAGGVSWNEIPMTLRTDGYWRATMGPFKAGTVVFRIYAEDTGSYSTASGAMTLPVVGCDVTKPSITAVSAGASKLTVNTADRCAGRPMTTYVQATVYDVSGLKWVRLYYQVPGTSTWAYVPMTRVVNNTFRATLGPFTSAGTARYYVASTDKLGNGPAKSAKTDMPVTICP